jgi:hypothetical protein
LARLFHFLKVQRGQSCDAMWQQITELVTRALFVAEDVIPHAANSFELLGFDVLLDSNLKPWLIEVKE